MQSGVFTREPGSRGMPAWKGEALRLSPELGAPRALGLPRGDRPPPPPAGPMVSAGGENPGFNLVVPTEEPMDASFTQHWDWCPGFRNSPWLEPTVIPGGLQGPST